MKRETVKQMWESFAAAVFDNDTPEIQRSEMRRAFYAVCWGMLQKAKEVGEEAVSEEVGVAYLESLERELKAFQNAVATGRA